MKKRLLGMTAAVGAMALLAGCSGSPNGSEGGADGEFLENGTYTMALTSDLGGMNPYLERQNFGYGVSSWMYDSLVNIDSTGEISSGIAEKWETTPDQIVFTIRDDVTCSSGEEITAEYIAKVIEWNQDPANASSMYTVYTSNVPSTVSFDEAARTVTVDYESPDGLALQRLGLLPIVCSAGLEDPSILATQSDGTGPYVLESAQQGDRYTMVRREGYNWGPGGATNNEPGSPEKVVIRIIADETTRANLLISGEINTARIVGPDRARLDGQGLDYYDEQVGGAWLNISENPDRVTGDFEVRTAMIQAINIPELVQIATDGRGNESTSLTVLAPQVCAAQDPVSTLVPEFDVDAANQTLEDAGWVMGADGIREKDGRKLTVNVVYQPAEAPQNTPTAEYYADRWKSVGIDTVLNGVDSAKAYEILLKTMDFDVFLGANSFYLPSAQIRFLVGPQPPEGYNSGFHVSEEYEENVAIALGMTPPDACEYWIRAEQALIQNLGWVPIANRFAGWYFNGAEGSIESYSKVVPTSVRLFQ